MKTVGLIAAATLATANFANEAEQPLQIAQLTDGFNAENTYMASCFAASEQPSYLFRCLGVMLMHIGVQYNTRRWQKVVT